MALAGGLALVKAKRVMLMSDDLAVIAFVCTR